MEWVSLTRNKKLYREEHCMWHKTPRIVRESAGSEMNTAFDSSDLPQDRTPEMVRQGSPMPFHGKGHAERDLYDDVSLCCCLTHSSESEGSLCFHLHILSFHPFIITLIKRVLSI
uniref:Uncharacterized protein n=1 Tax=Salix viminalis TaxID=40686 RepID=A0A6N2K9X2_SALVM